jgi:serine phosphatase RsbU (regulator of sigma subunit)
VGDAAVPGDLARVIRDFPDAVLIVGSSGRILLASDAAGRMFARPPSWLIGRPLASLVPDPSVQSRLESLVRGMEGGRDRGVVEGPVRVHTRRPDEEQIIEVDLTISATTTTTSDDPVALVSLHEPPASASIDEPHEIWRYFDVAVRLVDRLNSAADEQEVLASILPTMFSRLSWDVACLWLVAPDRRRLMCAATWPDDGGPNRPFEEASRVIRPAVGEGLPGSAWGSGRPLMSSVGIGEIRLLRQEAIRACGLQMGVAFPLVAEAGVVGVIEMFTRHSYPVSLRLLDGLASIGRHIGQLLDHTNAESRLRAEERMRSFLLEAATVLSGSTDYADSLARLATIAVPELADLCLIDVREADGKISRMAAVHADPSKAGLVAELEASYPPARGSSHPSNDVLVTGSSSWSATMSDEYLRQTTRDERHFEIVKELGFESYMCVPLRYGQEVLGVITLVSAGSGRRFQASDLALPEELAARAANVVASARRHETEHRLAHQLQRLLLPERLPEVPGFDLCVRYAAGAPQADAGGDFYDVVRLPSNRIGLLIGDVEGHDTIAAATMGQLRSASRALAGQVDEPFELIDALRWSWQLLGFQRFATALFARLDPETGEIVMASAGHLPPAHIQAGGVAGFVDVEPSPPLGAPGSTAHDHRLTLGKGDLFFLYTDGLVEHRSVALAECLDRLLGVLREPVDCPLDELCGHVLGRLGPSANGFDHSASGSLHHDDIAILGLKRRAD